MNTNYLPLLAVSFKSILTVVLIVLAVIIVVLIVLSIIGKKLQKKQNDSQEAMQAASQVISLLVIDKKRLKLKDAGLPSLVLEQTPKYLRRSKVPIVKAKIGPKIMSLMCEEKIFEQIPVKKEVKAVISGIYIMDIKGSRNNLEAPKKKRGFWSKVRRKAIAETQKDTKNAPVKKNKKQ